jgi:prepilin-type N-terminal cleavage/methylation domain-containing protein
MRFPQRLTGHQAGFTMVEMLVAVLILGIVSIGLFQTLVVSRDSYEQQKVTVEMQQNARAALEALADDFRHVSYGKDPTQPSIIFADHDSITFVADILTDIPGAEVISYSLSSGGDGETPNPNDTVLLKTVTDSAGTLVYVEPQSYGIKTGGLNIRYFNGAGVEMTTTPVPSPELVGEVLITVIAMEPRAHKQSGTYLEETLSTTIYPRNLPLTPARSRPSMPGMGSLTSPNCESVTVNWTRPTTNTDGSPLDLDDISNFTVWFGTSPSEMSLYSRTARTITQWTVSGLTGGQTYYFSVTCTSRSGVESYKPIVSYSLSSGLIPQVPSGVTWIPNPAGAGWRIQWNAVTLFTSGATIPTPVDYTVYRSTTTGFVPTPADVFVIQEAQTWAIDSTMTDCTDYYFVISATACGNEGAPTTEFSISSPTPPACPPVVAAVLTANVGEIRVTWTLPTLRIDGSPLASSDVSTSRVYYDTAPYTYTTWVDVAGPTAQAVISGLTTCTTYYVNVRCFDQCPQQGDLCMAREFSIDTSVPCDPGPPANVPFVRGDGMDQRIDFAWPANTGDCDIDGYYLYYGTTSGAYTGTGAVQGNSPIFFDAPAITGFDDTCRVSLTGLQTCRYYYVAVKAVDGCSPANMSALSSEVGVQTECMACQADAGCVRYATGGTGATDVRLEIYSAVSGETIVGMTPQWSGAATVSQVYAGRPLVCIWNSDGSAGGDGNIGPQPSGVTLNVNDFSMPTSACEADGLPLRLLYSAGMQGQTMTLDFLGTGGGWCSADPRTVRDGIVYDDFDDLNTTGWTFTNGTWSAATGELYQSVSTTAYGQYGATYGSVVIEAKIKILSSATPNIIFRANMAAGTYYQLGLVEASDIVRLGRYVSGSYTTTQQTNVTLTPGTWHMLRVEVNGTTAKAYFDCTQVLQVTDAQMLATGRIGIRTYSSKAYFDDFRVYTWTPS